MPAPKSKHRRLIKHGRRTYGAVYELASGQQVYLAWRKTKELYRGKMKTPSEAIFTEKAAWAIDDETLRTMRRDGVNVIGIWVRDTGDKYITTLDKFFDPANIEVIDYQPRGGTVQRFLTLKHFAFSQGLTRL